MTTDRNYEVIKSDNGRIIKAWTRGVQFEDAAREQVRNVAQLPFIAGHIAVMPDVHWGMGATIGSVIPTDGAIIPAAVGVDIGCGIRAVQTSLTAGDLPDPGVVRKAIEAAVPHGRTNNGGKGDRGAWENVPVAVSNSWASLVSGFRHICLKHPEIAKSNNMPHLGTLGTGNHFIEVCLDETDRVWFMLHSGSRGVGNKIGTYFIKRAKQAMKTWHVDLPDPNLAYFPDSTQDFDDYMEAVEWAQDFAFLSRALMMGAAIKAVSDSVPEFSCLETIDCHHNYVARERHFGKNIWVTRKGAVRARKGDLGIIPGSMGAKSYIVEGKGSTDSLRSCSHGAGRVMSRTQARNTFTVDDHAAATAGVECRKDADMLDETPGAYKSIDDVMEAQKDLVSIRHTLRQIVCVKG